MKKSAFLIPLLTLTLLGCHKNSNPAAPTAEANAAAPAPAAPQADGSAPVSPPPPPSAAVNANAQNAPLQNVTGEVNPFLTQQLRIFIQQKGRLPQSFAEFARARLDSIPHPPDGQKWVIDTATQEVKSAPAQ